METPLTDGVNTRPPPQAKLPGSKPYKAERNPEILPVPFIRFPTHRMAEPGFAPNPPAGRPFLWPEIPGVKLRGLGPADSIILRHAMARRLFDPDRFFLGPLIPWTPPAGDGTPPGVDRNLLMCPDAPMQADGVYHHEWKKPPGAPSPKPTPAAPRPERRPYPDYGTMLIVEIKPNAGYVALGQVLAYHWAWMMHFGERWPLRAAILTDLARPYMPALCLHHDVQLIAVGDQIVEPPPWPT